MEDEKTTCQQYTDQLTDANRQLENLQNIISHCEVELRQQERDLS